VRSRASSRTARPRPRCSPAASSGSQLRSDQGATEGSAQPGDP
jgi:hypothetical protein